MQIARARSIVWPKMPAYLQIKEWSAQWGLCNKGVRSEREEARDAQNISGIQMDLEQRACLILEDTTPGSPAQYPSLSTFVTS